LKLLIVNEEFWKGRVLLELIWDRQTKEAQYNQAVFEREKAIADRTKAENERDKFHDELERLRQTRP